MPQKKNWKHSATRINAAEAVATKAVVAKATVVAKVAAKEKDAEAVEAANN